MSEIDCWYLLAWF